MLDLEPGAVIDDLYEIVAPIGRGGMAAVYAARQLDGSGEVAVKVMSVDGEDRDELKRRFFRELLLATRVRHPNIVEVHDFGVMRGTGAPYLVMELLRGNTLHRELKRGGPLANDRATRLFLGALEALAEAHALGVVHKDLKPSNLFLCANDDGTETLVVLDFGIAHRIQAQPEAARVEWTATPRYAAPEYILRHEVRPCLDVYQMGLVLAEALSGRPVVASSDPEECFRAHLEGRLQLPAEVLSSDLAATIRRAIHPDPEQRYADAGQLFAALKAAAAGEMPSIRRTAPPAPDRRVAARAARAAAGMAFEEAGDGDAAPTRRFGATPWPSTRTDDDGQPTQPSGPGATPATGAPVITAPTIDPAPVPGPAVPPPPASRWGLPVVLAAVAAAGALAFVGGLVVGFFLGLF